MVMMTAMKASENALTLSGPGRLSVIDSSALLTIHDNTYPNNTLLMIFPAKYN